MVKKKSCKKYQYQRKNSCRNYAWFKNKSLKERNKIKRLKSYCGKGKSLKKGVCRRKSAAKPKPKKRKSAAKPKKKRKSAAKPKKKRKSAAKPKKRKSAAKPKKRKSAKKRKPAANLGPRPIKKVKLLGSGQFGKVFETLDIITGKTFALKEIKIKDLRDKKMVDDEISILKKLGCSKYTTCIFLPELTFYDPTQNPKIYYVAMGLASGIELEKFIVKKSFPNISFREFLKIKKHLYDGLAYIHKHGIAHLDIKPANIMIDPETLETKFIDFGLSCKTKLCIKGGTDGFLSPFLDAIFHNKKIDNFTYKQSIEGDKYALRQSLCWLYNEKVNKKDLGTDRPFHQNKFKNGILASEKLPCNDTNQPYNFQQ